MLEGVWNCFLNWLYIYKSGRYGMRRGRKNPREIGRGWEVEWDDDRNEKK